MGGSLNRFTLVLGGKRSVIGLLRGEAYFFKRVEGTGETTLMELGGWKSHQSMRRYMHLNHEYKAKAASTLEGMVMRRGLDQR